MTGVAAATAMGRAVVLVTALPVRPKSSFLDHFNSNLPELFVPAYVQSEYVVSGHKIQHTT